MGKWIYFLWKSKKLRVRVPFCYWAEGHPGNLLLHVNLSTLHGEISPKRRRVCKVKKAWKGFQGNKVMQCIGKTDCIIHYSLSLVTMKLLHFCSKQNPLFIFSALCRNRVCFLPLFFFFFLISLFKFHHTLSICLV